MAAPVSGTLSAPSTIGRKILLTGGPSSTLRSTQ